MHQKSKRAELKFQVSRTKSDGVILGSIIATLIAITPFVFNLYESVPDVKVWDTFLFRYESLYYESVFVLAWTLASKFIPLFLMLIWFFTCRHWWYHVLLIPIGMFIYQIIVIFDDDLSFADENELLYLLPVMAIIIPSIYLIRAQMFNKLNTVDKSMEDLEEEFKIKPTTLWGKIKQYF
ncbi:hypothetical protein LRR18_08860 [Mangrovimonas sp. AS39]|uniref:hypothetical protein n=1 Tax=Mangrovimonas futianensis TaxID=2895523 RepID=UPI001E33F697|nr:hypothetical protein [Mangrovimonas futianensis]MCF1191693.1 hypothetical protein [Mangrovimonas futianensis]MCF1195419.1 hypothetical protein [Mangrovimonas futianensis]MCF1421976.1 hypothetical protein [Mangrovimonas futianensis]